MAGPAGYYAVDDAPYLRYWNGAVFDPYFWYDDVNSYNVTTDLTPTDTAWSAGSKNIECVNDPASPMYGFCFISSQNRIYVFVNRVHTYTIVKDGSVTGTPWGMCYDSNHPNRIYFNLAFSTAPSVYYSDFNGTSFTDITSTNVVSGGLTGTSIALIFNPVNGHKYAIGVSNNIYDIDATDTFVGTMNGADVIASANALGVTIVGANWVPGQYVQVDSNGNIWVTQSYIGGNDTTGVADIIVIDGSLSFGAAGTNSANLLYVIDLGADGNAAGLGLASRLGPQPQRIGYYPGDGTPGSERMIFYGSTDAVGNPTTTGELYAYDNNGLIKTGGWVVDPRFNEDSIGGNINAGAQVGAFYSSINNSILALKWLSGQQWLTTSGSLIENVDDNGFGNQAANMAVDDISNGQIILYYTDTVVDSDVTYITPSTGTIACGNGGIASMYLYGATNDGPYRFNSATLQWEPCCSFVVTNNTPSGTQFTVTATLEAGTVSGSLIYSSDGGLTWSVAGPAKTSAEWSAGVVFNKADFPVTPYQLKIVFLTADDCGLNSAFDNTFYTP